MSLRIYLASSWRNPHQPGVVERLRAEGFDVYDFRNPPHGRGGFSWSDCDPDWKMGEHVTPHQWQAMLAMPPAVDGFASDFDAMKWADVCVLLLPCGRSAHLELGWFTGQNKPTCVLALEPTEPDLMVKLADVLASSVDDCVAWLKMRVFGGPDGLRIERRARYMKLLHDATHAERASLHEHFADMELACAADAGERWDNAAQDEDHEEVKRNTGYVTNHVIAQVEHEAQARYERECAKVAEGGAA